MGFSSKYFWRFGTLNPFWKMYSYACGLLPASKAESFRRGV